MAAARKAIDVYADWQGRIGPPLLGTLHAHETRGHTVFSFEYAAEWLRDARAVVLDPALPAVRGPQYAGDRDQFGMFRDASPDRWGRVLLQRREAWLARRDGRTERRLGELDFLLGVFDGHRLGALRFRIGDGPFLDDNVDLASPPWTTLRELEHAALSIERDKAERNAHYADWLRMLVAPGRSLGGARPKASVVDPRGQLWLAKFPRPDDLHDFGAWEAVVHALALRAGVTCAEAQVTKLGSRHQTFLVKRFDRTASGARLHFASAMTLLDRRDGDPASYLDLAAALNRYGAHPARDLEQLWRRVVFSMCVSNNDDHLRNHGFMLARSGWTLSPAYDLNPNPHGGGLHLNVSETDNALDLELARDVAKHFRVKPRRADEIIAEVTRATSTWRAAATKLRISRAAQDAMALAFKLAVRAPRAR